MTPSKVLAAVNVKLVPTDATVVALNESIVAPVLTLVIAPVIWTLPDVLIDAAVKTIDGIPQLAPLRDPPLAEEISYTIAVLDDAPVAISNTADAVAAEQMKLEVWAEAAAKAAVPTGANVSRWFVPMADVSHLTAPAAARPAALTGREFKSALSRARRTPAPVVAGVVVAAAA